MKKIIYFLIIIFFVSFPIYAGLSISNVTISNISLSQSGLGDTIFDMTNSANYYDLLYSITRSGYLETNDKARGRFTTTSTSLIVVGFTNMYTLHPEYANLGVRVDNVDYANLDFTGSGSKTFNVSLPPGTKTIEVVSGAQAQGDIGSWPTSVTFVNDPIATLSPPTFTKRIVLVGDSIVTGYDSDNPSLQAWPMLMRSHWNGTGSIISNSWGGRDLHEDCTSVGTCQTLANTITSKFSGVTDKFVYIQVSTNDYGASLWSAASFGTNYVRLLDDIISNDGTIQIYAQTATTRAVETANAFGSTLNDYRTQISNACTARPANCTVVDGPAILSYPTDYFDTVHPSLAGQTIYFDYVGPLFSIP